MLLCLNSWSYWKCTKWWAIRISCDALTYVLPFGIIHFDAFIFFLLYLIFFVLQMNCFHGFIKRANTKEETCPACKRSFCNECSQIWQVQHLNVTCSAYAKWMKDNCITIADQISIKIDENAENVSKCPKCKFTFILIRLVCCLLLFIAHSSFNQMKII